MSPARRHGAVPGTPRWAVVAAYGTVASVLPSAIWRSALGLGADLGMPRAWRDFQNVPGTGTVYVLVLSVVSLGAAALTLGLVYRWGEVVPSWIPRVGGRRVPVAVAVVPAVLGACAVMVIGAVSAASWEAIIGFKGMPDPGWYALATAAYLPALLWGPLLLAVTWAYARRRLR